MGRLFVVIFVLAGLVGAGVYLLWPRQTEGLTLYSAVDYGPAVAAAFTKETGIPVTLVDLSTGALLAKVSAEGKRPAWSLVWFDGDLAASALDHAGLLEKHTAPRLLWNATGRALLPADGSYAPTGLTLAGVFSYRADATPPARWNGLLAPAYRNEIGMNNPAISGPMYPLLAGMLHEAGGWPKGQFFVLALGNNGLHVYTKNANTLAALKQGQIKVAITQSSAALYVAAHDPAQHVVFPSPAFALPSVIAVAPHQSAAAKTTAERFIRFAMSPAVQRLRMAKGEADGVYWPVTTDTPPPKNLPVLSSLNVTVLNPQRWGSREQEVNAWFSKAVLHQ